MTAALQGAGTNYTTLVKPLQWLVVVVIFLFFLRVARAVTVQAKCAARRLAERLATQEPALRPRVHRARHALRAARRARRATSTSAGRQRAAWCSTTPSSRGAMRASTTADQGLVLADLGSTNGTFVNEKMIGSPTRLKRGDVVQIGSFVFEVVR